MARRIHPGSHRQEVTGVAAETPRLVVHILIGSYNQFIKVIYYLRVLIKATNDVAVFTGKDPRHIPGD